MADDLSTVEHQIKELENHEKAVAQVNKETEEAIEMLSSGILSAFYPGMANIKEKINELTQNQEILMETMQQENAKFVESQEAKALLEVVAQVQKYNNKLREIQYDMGQINERIAKLKRRAHKLKQNKVKDEKMKQDAKRREQEIEQELIAKPASELQRP